MLHPHFVFILLGLSHFPRTDTEPIDLLQHFLGVTLVNMIFGDNLCCTVTTRENPSSSACFVPTSSAGGRATNKALQLLLSSNACQHALLLGQIAAAFVQYHATAKVSTCSVFSFHRY